MDRWKSRVGKSQRREEKKREDQRRERVRRKKMQVREKVGKLRFTVFFPMICGSGGSKSRLAKAAGAEPCSQLRDEKVHAVVARSTFTSQTAQSTAVSDRFLAIEMAKKCTMLRREARVQVKSAKKMRGRDHFWLFRCRFAWQAQGIVHLVKSQQNVKVL